jgi:hypothetical protein
MIKQKQQHDEAETYKALCDESDSVVGIFEWLMSAFE